MVTILAEQQVPAVSAVPPPQLLTPLPDAKQIKQTPNQNKHAPNQTKYAPKHNTKMTTTPENDERFDPTDVLNSAMLVDDNSSYMSDAYSVSSGRERRTKRRRPAKYADDDNEKCDAAARTQLWRDTKEVRQLRLLGRVVPADMVYVEASHEERQQGAKEKVVRRRNRRRPNSVDEADDSPPARMSDTLHAAPAAAGAYTETTRSAPGRRILPLVAAGVHVRQLKTARAQYTAPVIDIQTDSQVRGGLWSFG